MQVPRPRDVESQQSLGETEPSFVEFWVWHDGELLPATDDELVWIRERERERAAQWRLHQWSEHHEARRSAWLAAWLGRLSHALDPARPVASGDPARHDGAVAGERHKVTETKA